MKFNLLVMTGVCLSLNACSFTNVFTPNGKVVKHRVHPRDQRAAAVFDGDLKSYTHEVQKESYEKGYQTAMKKYSLDGKGGFYPDQHIEKEIRYIDARHINKGAGFKLENGTIPVLVDSVEWMKYVAEPMPGVAKIKKIKNDVVFSESVTGEMK